MGVWIGAGFAVLIVLFVLAVLFCWPTGRHAGDFRPLTGKIRTWPAEHFVFPGRLKVYEPDAVQAIGSPFSDPVLPRWGA